MKLSYKVLCVALASTALYSLGCGVDALFFDAVGPEHSKKILPEVKVHYVLEDDWQNADVQFVVGSGDVVIPENVEQFEQGYTATLPPERDYNKMRIVAVNGSAMYKTIVPKVVPGEVTEGGFLDNISTAATLTMEAKITAGGFTLASQPMCSLITTWNDINSKYSQPDGSSLFLEFQSVKNMIGRLQAAARANPGAPPLFQNAVFKDDYSAEHSGLNPDFLHAVAVDYDGDGMTDSSTAAFDNAVGFVAESFEFSVNYDPTNIRMVFMVHMNPGKTDLNCTEINRFQWAKYDSEASMFIDGGVWENEDGFDQATIDRVNERFGRWTPNNTAMYDDGTHGDTVAGDNVWTFSIDVPVGMRFGYKYTWGHAGSNWSGTQEWPGNRRLLQATDINGDYLVIRYDFFGDETMNKDKSNLFGRGEIDFTTDQDGDGIPDARERPFDREFSCSSESCPGCVVDTWPKAAMTPLVLSCEE